MRTQLLISILFLTVLLGTAAEPFADAFRAADQLLTKQQYAEAHEAFLALSAAAPNAHGRQQALAKAAWALGLSGEVTAALELASSNPDQYLAGFTRLQIYDHHRQDAALLAEYGEADLASWPDQLNYRALFLRGCAWEAEQKHEAAVADLRQCIALAGSDSYAELEARDRLGVNLQRLQQTDAAIEAYQQALDRYDSATSNKGRWIFPKTFLSLARLYMEADQLDLAAEALTNADEMPPRENPGPWGFLILETRADLLLLRGEQDAARDLYEEALTIDTHEAYLKRAREKLETLTP